VAETPQFLQVGYEIAGKKSRAHLRDLMSTRPCFALAFDFFSEPALVQNNQIDRTPNQVFQLCLQTITRDPGFLSERNIDIGPFMETVWACYRSKEKNSFSGNKLFEREL